MAGELPLQDNAADADQIAFADRKAKERVARRRELWRWLMNAQIGRELLYDVILGELGFLRAIRGDVADMYSQAALHNLCCRLMAEDIFPHRELYLQMQQEALKREAAERQELEAARVKWASRENES